MLQKKNTPKENFTNNFVQLHFAITFVKYKVLQKLRYYFYNSTVQCNFNAISFSR